MANSNQPNFVGMLKAELANREQNLRVIQETIENDPKAGTKLIEVRDLLLRRISELRNEIRLRSERSEIEIAA